MRENKEEPSAIWRAEMNLLDLIRTYKTKKILRKTGGEETTTKLTTTYAKKTYANLSQKKSTVFPSYHSQNSTNYKKTKNTIHHHIKKSHTHFKMILKSKNCTKSFYEKEKCMRKSKKKHWRNPTNSYKFLFKILLPNMSIIHINLLVILSTHVCASMFKNSHFIKQKWSRHNFSILPIYGKISCLLPLLLYEKKNNYY